MWFLFFFFSSQLCCPLRFQNSPQTCLWESFLLFGNFSSFRTPSPGRVSIPNSFVSFCLLFFCLTFFWREWAAFLGAWCPLPAFRSSFFVNLLSVHMFFQWFCGGGCGLSVLFLHYLRTAPQSVFLNWHLLMKLGFYPLQDWEMQVLSSSLITFWGPWKRCSWVIKQLWLSRLQ